MIKILVDSSSDIDEKEAKSMGVDFMPLEIMIDGVTYLDGVNLSHEDFFKKLIESATFPKTSQITEFRYEEKLKEMTKDGDSVIVIALSSKLSGTYNQAVSASKKFENVFVVDSLNACIGERILIQYALKLRNEKLSASEIVEKLETKKKHIKLIALLDTLKYLKKGGRISSLVAFAGTMLNIKPVVSVEKGEVKLIGKAIGSKKGNNLLNEFIKKSNGIDFDLPYATAFSGFDKTMLDKYIEDSGNLWEGFTTDIPRYMIGSTIGTHIGPGGIAVAFFEKEVE